MKKRTRKIIPAFKTYFFFKIIAIKFKFSVVLLHNIILSIITFILTTGDKNKLFFISPYFYFNNFSKAFAFNIVLDINSPL